MINHFVAMKPLWSTNILYAKTVWEKMKRPQNSKNVVLVGMLSNVRHNIKIKKNITIFKVSTFGRFLLNLSIHLSYAV